MAAGGVAEADVDVGWSLDSSPLICSTFSWCDLLRWHFYFWQTNKHTSEKTKRTKKGNKASVLEVTGRKGSDPLHFSSVYK